MRLASRYRRFEPARTGVLIGGIAAAAASFTLLCMNATALTVQIHGTLPVGSPHRAYDILVRMPSRVSQQSTTAAAVRPTDLTELSGGITLGQYDKIRSLPGVQVAAPMTMIGYVPLTAVLPVTVPAAAITPRSALYMLTGRQVSDDGLSSRTLPNAGSTYVTANRACPRSMAVQPAPARSGVTPSRAACWSTATGPDPQTWPGVPPKAVSVPFEWTFWLPLVAVDPTAEARLLHLDRAVVGGHYLPTAAVSSPAEIPVIIASSIADDQTDELNLVRRPASANSSGAVTTASLLGAPTDTSAAQQVGTSTVSAAQAYQALLQNLGTMATASVPAYWTPSPTRYQPAANGALTPQPVTSAAGTSGFRALTVHVARTSTASEGNGLAPAAAPAGLRAVGVFDPTSIANSAATPSPYLGEKLPGADTRSQWLLSGLALGPDGNPAGYPSPGATLVMPLQDIGAFTSTYTGTNARAPIGSIRVRVAGASGDDALSRERVRVVAQEIVRATGLHVEVTLAASAAVRTIDLPAGNGRPVLHLSEVWYRTDTPTTVLSALDPRSIALSAVVLLMGAAFAASGVLARLRRRRRELATLRALGWPRGPLSWRFAREFGLITAAAGALAAVAVYAVGTVVMGRVAVGWLLLSVGATAAMTFGAAWWPVRRATGDAKPKAGAAGLRARNQRRPAGVVGHAISNLRRAPGRTMLGVFVIAVACAALGLELVVRWLFGGVIVGSWLGIPVSWQQQPIDAVAVITILALAVIASADISWRNGGERAADKRTLRAIGWPSRDLARLDACEAALVGVTGGFIATALDVASLFAVGHEPPVGLALVSAAVVGTGAVISLIAAALCAAAWRATRANATA